VSLRPQTTLKVIMGQKKQRCGKRGNRKMKVRSAGMPARKMNPPLLAGPKVVKQALPFLQFFGLTEAAANTGIDRVYRLNDIYDPDYTGAGTTAFGTTAWSNLFTRFLVTKVEIEATFVNTLANTDTIVGFVFTAETTALPSSPRVWFTAPYGGSKQLGPAQSSCCRYIHRQSVIPWTILGITKQQYYDDPDFYCTNLSSPSRVLYGHVAAWGNANSSIVNGSFKAVYHVECFKPVLVSP